MYLKRRDESENEPLIRFSILRDDYGTLQTIKNDFAENLSAVDVENVNREKVTFSRK